MKYKITGKKAIEISALENRIFRKQVPVFASEAGSSSNFNPVLVLSSTDFKLCEQKKDQQ